MIKMSNFFKYFPKKKGLRQKDINRKKLKNFVIELKVRGLSEKTIDAYLHFNNKFLQFIKKEQKSITGDDIKAYQNYLMLEGVGPRTMNLAISALKCYYESYLGKKLFKKVKRSKVPQDFDPIISKKQIMGMINNTRSLKHRLLIELLYSSGMRVGECVKLKVDDIGDRVIYIRHGKGKKDRFTITSENFLADLRNYLNNRKSKSEYIFDNGFNKHISVRTAEEIISHAAKRTGIKRRIYPHLLRACFATHLLQDKIPIEKVQKLLGHSDIKTTRGYARHNVEALKTIKSPLDKITHP
jgi:site-specific recombinase XerD